MCIYIYIYFFRRVRTDATTFARSLVLPAAGGSPLDAASASCLILSPLGEAHVVGAFDCRSDGRTCDLALGASAAKASARPPGGVGDGSQSLGMCMALCALPALGATHVLATYESTDTCVWDLRAPRAPLLPSVLAGDPASPAICAAAVWKRAWVACADGGIRMVRIRADRLQPVGGAVEAAPVAYAPAEGATAEEVAVAADEYQAMKI